MAIDLFWDDDAQTVMLVEFHSPWSWDDLRRVLKTIQRLSSESGMVYGAILDLREGLRMPDGSILSAENLQQFRQMWTDSADQEKGPVVIVGMNRAVKLLFETVGRIEPSATRDVHFCDTLDEARELIYPAVVARNTAT